MRFKLQLPKLNQKLYNLFKHEITYKIYKNYNKFTCTKCSNTKDLYKKLYENKTHMIKFVTS